MIKKQKQKITGLPSAEAILDFIRNAPGASGKREISRHFNLSGADKIALKALLKQLEQEGKLAKSRKRLIDLSTLPPVTVLEISKVSADGDLYGEPLEWDEKIAGKPPKVRILSSERRSKTSAPTPAPARGDRVLAKIFKGDGSTSFTAQIIRLLSDKTKRVLGVYRVSKHHGARLIPIDKKARHELTILAGDEMGALDGELVEAEVIKDRGRATPRAKVRERLGDMNDQRNISLIAIHTHAIPQLFSSKVEAEVKELKAFTLAGRKDWRALPLITIDPKDARDHDDAVYAKADDDPKNPGGFELVVAIADVAAYVRPGTALDREARVRGNSVYFPDRVVPMLPERISNDLCSLVEGKDRPALACIMMFDKQGHKLRHRFERIVMRSAAKLSYEEAQAAIDGKVNDKTGPLLAPVLQPLWAAYGTLTKARDERAPLELDLPERRLLLDDQGQVIRVVTPERLAAHRLIEEFMIQANVAAAEELEKHKTPLLYRVHDQPTQEKIRNLAQFLKTVDLSLAAGNIIKPKDFNVLLKQVAGKDYQQLVNDVVLRAQAQAIYTPQNIGHFGLALKRYAHFTSPIRRYADLIVHRALVSALGFGTDGLSSEDISQLQETADMISDAERRAMAAERETIDRLVASFLSDQTGAVFAGRIAGVVGAGLFIKLNDNGADGFVPVSSLGRDYFIYDEVSHALIGQATGISYQLGDKVEVRLLEVAPISGGLRFEMVSEGRPGKAPPRHSRPRSSRQKPAKEKKRRRK